MKKVITGCLLVCSLLATQPAFSAARVAVLHLAPFASNIDDTAVDILINGTVAFAGVKYKDFVDYTNLEAGDYTIDIVPVGAADPVLSGVSFVSRAGYAPLDVDRFYQKLRTRTYWENLSQWS